ncbi:MAG: hypothetical protein MJZ12_01990 [Prevotella sp.]|nr:hypothetical protein [Prevotella sp.]
MKILSSKQYGVNLKATVQSTGKLGFSGPTATALELSAGGFIRFGQDEDADETLYLAVMEGVDEDGFKIMQSGGYYSVNTRTLFEALNVDYKSQTVIYDLQRDPSKDEGMGGRAYRMTPRILPKKQSEASERSINDNNGGNDGSDAENSENIEDV